MRLVRLLLFPFSLLYGLVVVVRNMAYDYKILRSSSFHVPVILVGNLAVGGTGKSPMIAYLVNKLKSKYKIAILSRGYGRQTKGFFLARPDSTSKQIGDEPLQLKGQFPEATVAVCEDRVKGINRLASDHSLILMDDGYQHRAAKPRLSVLLFDYNTIFEPQWLLPTGNLREPLCGRKRADVIIITKTPQNLTQADRLRSISQIDPYPHQQVFFSYLAYGNLQALSDTSMVRSLESITQSTQIMLLTGIANANPLLKKLRQYSEHVYHHQYSDHHRYEKKDILKLMTAYANLDTVDRVVITTEKDAQRLKDPVFKELLNNLSMYYIPVQVVMHQPDKENFDGLIETFV